MTGKRYKRQGSGSFFGEYLYDRTVADGHFLRQLEGLVDWEAYAEKLVRLYRGRAKVGPPPYNPSVILKMLLLAYLYDLSERRTKAFVDDSLPAKHFLGLAADEAAPDHSTLTAFKRRIVKRGGEGLLEELLKEVVQAAQGRGVALGCIQVVDSTHTIADVNIPRPLLFRHPLARGGTHRWRPRALWLLPPYLLVDGDRDRWRTRLLIVYSGWLPECALPCPLAWPTGQQLPNAVIQVKRRTALARGTQHAR